MPFFKNKTANIYYETPGSGTPLLLINGIAGDTRQWQPLIEKLKGRFEIVTYDMRCAGKSDKPDKSFSIEDLADEASALIRHLGHNKISVLGFSMGGMVTIGLALRNPEIVDKIFLVATAPSMKRPDPPSDHVMSIFRETEISRKLLTEVYESIFGSRYKAKFSADEFVNFRLNDDIPQPAFAYLRQLEALESCDLYDDVEKISAPSFIIAGKEDKVIPPENSNWLHKHIIDSKLCTLNGVGHMIPLEAAEELAEILIGNR